MTKQSNIIALAILSSCYGPALLQGQEGQPAAIFRLAIEQIRSKVQIPILLPSKLPSGLLETDIKSVSGEVRKDGYFISLYFTEDGNASYAAGFGASTDIDTDIPNTRRIRLANGRVGLFRPVSCGGSCAPANLWWEQNGVQYNIQIKLPYALRERDQERPLVEAANSTVVVARK